MSFKFNPTVNNYLTDNPNKTMLGLSWSIFWRVYLLIFLAGCLFGILSAI